MFSGIYSTGVQVEMNYHKPTSDNMEEYGQRHGRVVRFPTVRDLIKRRAGQILISIGRRLAASGTRNMRLSQESR